MPDQHRATPEQWASQKQWASPPDSDPYALCLLELRDRIEALEATQHAHADVSRLSDAEQDRLAQELTKPADWRPLKIETTYGSEPAADAAQILSPRFRPHPIRSRMVVEGTFEHGGETYRFKANPERDGQPAPVRSADSLAEQNAPTTEDFLIGAPNALRAVRNFGREIGAAQIARSADSLPVKNQPATEDSSAPALAGSLVGRLANLLDPDDPICARGTARAAIRKVAKWLDDCCTQAGAEEPSYYDEPTASDAVRWLRQEADRG